MNTILNFAPLGIFIIMLGVGMSASIKSFLKFLRI